MKKLILLPCLYLALSCSSDSNSSNNSHAFHPPSWIRGTWNNGVGNGYKFTSNDFCSIISTTQFCNKETLDSYAQSGIDVSVDETISSTEYIFSIDTEGAIQNYDFIKINADEIEMVNPNPSLPNATFYRD